MSDWDTSLEYFLNGHIQKETGKWEIREQELQYCEVLDVQQQGLRAVWWSDFECRYRDQRHNGEECEEKKEEERKEESCIIVSLRPVIDCGSPVQVLDLPPRPPSEMPLLHCVQTWEQWHSSISKKLKGLAHLNYEKHIFTLSSSGICPVKASPDTDSDTLTLILTGNSVPLPQNHQQKDYSFGRNHSMVCGWSRVTQNTLLLNFKSVF